MKKFKDSLKGVFVFAILFWVIGYSISIFNSWSFAHWDISKWGEFGRTFYGVCLII